MADWGRTLDEILDDMTLPQFRLLTKMRRRRIAESHKWDLQIAGLSLATQEQIDLWQTLYEEQDAIVQGDDQEADMGGGFTASKRYPLLHEITEQQVMMDRHSRYPGLLSKIQFQTV